jgi:ribosomal protein S18 acetylase RimI-like enzyme
MLEIIKSPGAENVTVVRELFRLYGAWVETDLSFQNFGDELENLPGDYAPPEGCLFVAYYDDDPAGCVALRKSENGICEMKRLYVVSNFQGKGIGKSLIDRVIEEAKNLGYAKMRLDTLPQMASAQKLYRRLGFKEIGPYRYNPVEGTVFMELALTPTDTENIHRD